MRKNRFITICVLAAFACSALMSMGIPKEISSKYPESIYPSVIEDIESGAEIISVYICYRDRVLERAEAFRENYKSSLIEQGYDEETADVMTEEYYEKNWSVVNDAFYDSRNKEIIEHLGLDETVVKTLYHVPRIEAELSVEQILKASELEYVYMIQTTDYVVEPPTELPEIPTFNGFMPGDANMDSNVNLADAVAIMQYLSNPYRFPLLVPDYADVTGNRDGVTLLDALHIQRQLLGLN